MPVSASVVEVGAVTVVCRVNLPKNPRMEINIVCDRTPHYDPVSER